MLQHLLGFLAGAAIAALPELTEEICPTSDSGSMDGGSCDPTAAIINLTTEEDGTCGSGGDPCTWVWNITIYNVSCPGHTFACFRANIQGTQGGIGNDDWTWTAEGVELSCSNEESSTTFKYLVRDGGTWTGKVLGGFNYTLTCGACTTGE